MEEKKRGHHYLSMFAAGRPSAGLYHLSHLQHHAQGISGSWKRKIQINIGTCIKACANDSLGNF